MIKRSFWISKIRDAWKARPIVWLSGVRRVGKTALGTSCIGYATDFYRTL